MKQRAGLSAVAAVALFGAAALAGCGGGDGGGGTTTTAPTVTDTRSMDSTSETALTDVGTSLSMTSPTEGAAVNTGPITDVSTGNDLLTTTQTYLSATSRSAATTRATTNYTKIIGGLTITVGVTYSAITPDQVTFTVTLNGSISATGSRYSNFLFASGTVTRGVDPVTAKNGSHYQVTYNQLLQNVSTPLATGDYWVDTDGTGYGGLTFATSGTTTAWTLDASGTWVWSLYQNGTATTGKLRGKVTVNADHSGTAKLYCISDGLLRSQATWTAAETGQFCTYATTCSPNGDRPCVTYPKQ